MSHEQWNDILWRIDEFRWMGWFVCLYLFMGPLVTVKEYKEKP